MPDCWLSPLAAPRTCDDEAFHKRNFIPPHIHLAFCASFVAPVEEGLDHAACLMASFGVIFSSSGPAAICAISKSYRV